MKKTILFSMFLFSFLLLWCANNEVNREESTNMENKEIAEEVFNKEDCLKWCQMMGNVWLSDEWILEDCKKTCEIGEAVATNDENWCENADGEMRDACYSSVAYESSNASLCEEISDTLYQYSCYLSIAEKLQDKTICDKIDEESWKISCQSVVQTD